MVADAAPAVVKTPKKKTTAKPKKAAVHPVYIEMIQKGIADLKERGGSSRQALLKYIVANYKVGDNKVAINARVKTALKSGVTSGSLKQTKGTGASGSFRLGEVKKAAKPQKKAVTKPKKTVKSPKKVKKPTAAKATKSAAPKKSKPAAKKAAKPKKAAKSPKKTKTAKPKKAKTPKKKTATKAKKA